MRTSGRSRSAPDTHTPPPPIRARPGRAEYTTLHQDRECPRMRIQTILNRVEKFKSFVYGEAHIEEQDGGPALVAQVLPLKNSLPYCSGCLRRGRPYDHLKER